jgi:hypothetical protein
VSQLGKIIFLSGRHTTPRTQVEVAGAGDACDGPIAQTFRDKRCNSFGRMISLIKFWIEAVLHGHKARCLRQYGKHRGVVIGLSA